jgi:hypothetical protein
MVQDKVKNFKEKTSKFRVKNHEIQNINKEPLDWLNSVQFNIKIYHFKSWNIQVVKRYLFQKNIGMIFFLNFIVLRKYQTIFQKINYILQKILN